MTRFRCAIQDWHQLPAGRDWLTAAERTRLEEFRFEKRRRDWLLGRWTAKLALLRIAGLSERDVSRVEIATAPDGAPLPMLDGEPCDIRLSLSHSNGRAFSAAATGVQSLGCDLELIEPRGQEFIDTWFTASESERVERSDPQFRDSLVTLIWSIKESALKALRTGLQIDTRRVEVGDSDDRRVGDWNTGRTTVDEHGEFDCLWKFDGDFVLSVVVN